MKKFLRTMAVAMIAVMAISCSDDNKNTGNGNGNGDGNGDGNGGGNKEIVYRVKTFTMSDEDGGWADVYTYTYNEDGTIKKVYRDEEKEWNFAYSGTNVTVTKGDGEVAYTMTLGSNGYVSSLTDEWDDNRTYTYDSKGHVTEIKKNGEVVSKIVIQDDCIVSWTRIRDDEEQIKVHTYLATKNVGGTHNIHSEATDPSRWMYETGLFGKAPANLCETSRWSHSETAGNYSYTFHENNCVKRETKEYDGWLEYFDLTWEEVEIEVEN